MSALFVVFSQITNKGPYYKRSRSLSSETDIQTSRESESSGSASVTENVEITNWINSLLIRSERMYSPRPRLETTSLLQRAKSRQRSEDREYIFLSFLVAILERGLVSNYIQYSHSSVLVKTLGGCVKTLRWIIHIVWFRQWIYLIRKDKDKLIDQTVMNYKVVDFSKLRS